jgi:hypothetical protein
VRFDKRSREERSDGYPMQSTVIQSVLQLAISIHSLRYAPQDTAIHSNSARQKRIIAVSSAEELSI